MYDQLRDRIADVIARPRPMKPQTERQLADRLAERSTNLRTFLLAAAEALEDHELDVLFAPQFTPSLDDQAAVSDLLYHWRPSAEQIEQLVQDVGEQASHAVVELPDGSEARLTLHEVMVDRFVRLLRLDQNPEPAVAAALRDSLPNDLWTVAAALVRQRGFAPRHQAWFAHFVNHMTGLHAVGRGLLQTTADFIAQQPDLTRDALLEEARAQVKAANGSVAYARSGHAYWSPDVAQHHQYRGQGQIDQALIQQRQDEAQWLAMIEQDLQTFEDEA
jgi:hypothetical protein